MQCCTLSEDRSGPRNERKILGGGVARGLASERCSRVTLPTSAVLVSSETQNLIQQFLEKSAIVSKTAQYVERMLL